MNRTSGRVKLARPARELLEMAAKMADKHRALGGNSPLISLTDVNVDAVFNEIPPTLELHIEAEELKLRSEMKYRERDNKLKVITDTMRRSLKLLKAVYGDNPKKLAEWGVNVNDSTQAKPAGPKA